MENVSTILFWLLLAIGIYSVYSIAKTVKRLNQIMDNEFTDPWEK